MPLYFFDVRETERSFRDDTGTELAGLEEVRTEAMRFLPEVARDHIPANGDAQSFVVLVRDEDGGLVFSATLSYAGQWLHKRPS